MRPVYLLKILNEKMLRNERTKENFQGAKKKLTKNCIGRKRKIS